MAVKQIGVGNLLVFPIQSIQSDYPASPMYVPSCGKGGGEGQCHTSLLTRLLLCACTPRRIGRTMNAQVNFGSGGCYRGEERMKRVYVHAGEVNIYTSEAIGIDS